MNWHHIVLIFHILSASVWVGGHLILLFSYVPVAIKEKSPETIVSFRKRFEPIGLPSLLILVITGVIMAYDYNVKIENWFSFSSSIEKVVSLKLILVITTMILAVLATRFIFPNLKGKLPLH